MERDILEEDHLTVTTSDMLVEFVAHCSEELSAVRCLKGIRESHFIWIGGDECKHICA